MISQMQVVNMDKGEKGKRKEEEEPKQEKKELSSPIQESIL